MSIIVATRNRAQSLRGTLESLRRMTPPDGGWEVLVVDNGSTDGTAAVVAEYEHAMPGVVRGLHEPRQGKSIAVNTAVGQARGALLLFTDDDVMVDQGWCRAMVRAMDDNEAIGAGGRIVAEWTTPPPRWLAGDGPDRLMNVVAFDAGPRPGLLTAAPFGPNMAFRRAAFERYGLFRTDLGPGAGRYLPGQDTEFGRRLLDAGECLAWVPDAVVRHRLQPEKLRKRYVASWYFGYGRMAMRTAAVAPGTIRYFGVPRFLFRSVLVSLGRSAGFHGPERRFRHLAEACRDAGAIVEALVRRGERG